MNRLLIPALLLFTACNNKGNHTPAKVITLPQTEPIKNASTASTDEHKTIFEAIKTSKNATNLISDSRWAEYESGGDPDTALVLFGYRVIQQSDTLFEDAESHIRLYRECSIVKRLMPQIFKSDTTVHRVLIQLDNLNQRFKAYAESEVVMDIKEFGQSDGPLFDFISSLKNDN